MVKDDVPVFERGATDAQEEIRENPILDTLMCLCRYHWEYNAWWKCKRGMGCFREVYAGDEKLQKVKLHALIKKAIWKEYASQYLNKLFTLTHQMQRNGN